MRSEDIIESTLANMEEQATTLAQLLNILKWMKFDNCYKEENAVKDLWTVIENMLEFEKHLSS